MNDRKQNFSRIKKNPYAVSFFLQYSQWSKKIIIKGKHNNLLNLLINDFHKRNNNRYYEKSLPP